MTIENPDYALIADFVEAGHTEHCAKRQVWGDGECECPGDGTGSPHHTLNPPPGGWQIPRAEVPFGPGRALRNLRRHLRVNLGDAARLLGLSASQLSALERDHYEVKP